MKNKEYVMLLGQVKDSFMGLCLTKIIPLEHSSAPNVAGKWLMVWDRQGEALRMNEELSAALYMSNPDTILRMEIV